MLNGTAIACVVLLALVLVLPANFERLRGTPRSHWLSFAGGVALAYVFLKLLPELTRAQSKMMEHHPSAGWLREHLLFLVSLAGATALFAIERAAKTTKQRRSEQGKEARSADWVFWLHLSVQAVYAAFIAYLMFRGEEQRVPAVAATGAVMAVHFCGVAVALAEDYGSLFLKWGRWLLALAVLVGGVVGYAWELPELSHHLLLSLLAGAVIFSVIKEEIPPEQQSRAWAVAAGIATGTALLASVG